MDIYIPISGVQFHNAKTTYFSIKVTTFEQKGNQQWTGTSGIGLYKASFTIDYFNIDSFDNEQERFDAIMKPDFNMPMAKGCSEFIQSFKPFSSTQTFTMSYMQTSLSDYLSLAYDHNSGYLRKEWPGKSVSVWDLNEDLLYHVSTNTMSNLQANVLYPGNLDTCSVLKVTDDKLSAAYKPYSTAGSSLDLLNFLGAERISFIGHGEVREMPCLIYEAIISEPPKVFFMTDDHLVTKASYKIDYIIQFYLLEDEQDQKIIKKSGDEIVQLSNRNFWPAKISLYRRFPEQKITTLLDELHIYDFYNTLEGNYKKATELFMASECFHNDGSEQLKLELSIVFDEIHQNFPDEKSAENHRKLLAYNKLKLESYLINNLISLFQVSRLHLVEYEMLLKPHHVDLNLVLADREELKALVHFGEGNLPSENSYESNRLIIHGQSEERCVLFSSLIADISMVIYCPTTKARTLTSCTAVYGDQDPIIKIDINVDPLIPSCQVYRYMPTEQPLSGTKNKDWMKFGLKQHTFDSFEAVDPKDRAIVKLTGSIRDFDIEREVKLIVIDNYKFAAKQPEDQPKHQVKSYISYKYKTEGDCAKMCNLDPACRSFSYCSMEDTNSDEHSCYWSSLDLRGSKIKEQLIHIKANDGQDEYEVITVKGNGKDEYNLKFADRCQIYERNYINMFRQTDEVIRLSVELASQFQVAQSTFDCAKQSIDLELQYQNHHATMFAFCPSVNGCLLDEQTIESMAATTTSGFDEDSDSMVNYAKNELLCNVYVKKYQTYFNVSSQILKSNGLQSEYSNVGALGSVEDCARACWNNFGQICSSFDYCDSSSTSGRKCVINQISLDEAERGDLLELQSNCLHYERDLHWDELHREHLAVGKHELFNPELVELNKKLQSGNWFVTLITYSLSIAAIFVGLFLGVRVNDRLESVTIKRQSVSHSNGGPALIPRLSRQMFGFQSFPANDFNTSADEELNSAGVADNQFVSSANAIQLDVLRQARESGND